MTPLTCIRTFYLLLFSARITPDSEEFRSLDIVKPENFVLLTDIIEELTKKEVNTKFKAGQKLKYGYLLKTFGMTIRDLLSDESTKKLSERFVFGISQDSCVTFIRKLDFQWPALFGDVQKHVNLRWSASLRRPAEMPSEEEIQTLQLYMEKELDKIVKDTFAVWDTHYYVKARSLGNNFALFVETGVNLPILFTLKCIKYHLSLNSKYFHTPLAQLSS